MSQPLHLHTDTTLYHAEGVSDTNPSLKEFLSEHNIPDDVYSKLEEVSVDWNTLLHIEPSELDILCGKQLLNLPFMIKIKFKAAIKQLQLLYKPKTPQHIIRITMEEQKYLDQIGIELKKCANVQTLFENHFDQVEDHVVNIKEDIDNKFECIIQKLHQRKQLLYNQV